MNLRNFFLNLHCQRARARRTRCSRIPSARLPKKKTLCLDSPEILAARRQDTPSCCVGEIIIGSVLIGVPQEKRPLGERVWHIVPPLRAVVYNIAVLVDFLPVALEGTRWRVSERARKFATNREHPPNRCWNKSAPHYLRVFPVHFYTPSEMLFEKWRVGGRTGGR